MARVAVEEDDRGVGEQDADEEVPHHPAGRREPEDPIALLGVEVEVHLLQVLEQDAAVAVDDRLRQAGGARRVEDPERVVEGERRRTRARESAGPEEARPPSRCRRGSRSRTVRSSPGISAAIASTIVGAVEVAPAVAVAVDREQDLRLDLREAVDHAAGAELRRRRGPDRAQRGGGEEGGDRLEDVRQVGGDAVALADAERAPGRRGSAAVCAASSPQVHSPSSRELGGVADRRPRRGRGRGGCGRRS